MRQSARLIAVARAQVSDRLVLQQSSIESLYGFRRNHRVRNPHYRPNQEATCSTGAAEKRYRETRKLKSKALTDWVSWLTEM